MGRGRDTRELEPQDVFDASYLAGAGGLPSNGTPINLYDCLPNQYNQKWSFSGQWYHMNFDKCLKRDNDGNGSRLHLATCDSSTAEQFDYYPL